MKKLLAVCIGLIALAGVSYGQLTFYLVDNFEDGTFTKWYVFDDVKAAVINNPAGQERDSVSESCGEKSLKITGSAGSWYSGGLGTILDVDGTEYTRFLVDIYGNKNGGKLKVELFEKKSKNSTEEVKWTVELPVLGEGFTRYSVPFSAFVQDNNGKIISHPKKGGKITKLQLICVAPSEKGDVDLTVDNLIFTF